MNFQKYILSFLACLFLILNGCANGDLQTSGNFSSSNTAITLVQNSGEAKTSSTFLNINLPSAPMQGDLVVVILSTWVANITSLTDNKGNSYILATTSFSGGSDRSSIYYTIVNGTGAGFTITAVLTGSDPLVGCALEFYGIDSMNPLDVTANNSSGGSVTSASSGTTAPTSKGNELLIAGIAANQSGAEVLTNDPTWMADFYEPSNASYIGSQGLHKIVSSQSPYSHAWSVISSSTYAATIAAFRGKY